MQELDVVVWSSDWPCALTVSLMPDGWLESVQYHSSIMVINIPLLAYVFSVAVKIPRCNGRYCFTNLYDSSSILSPRNGCR